MELRAHVYIDQQTDVEDLLFAMLGIVITTIHENLLVKIMMLS
jgi:hypothetical protein